MTDALAGASAHSWGVAWEWLCRQRRRAPPNADIWHLWFHRSRQDAALYQQVVAGQYRLSPMQVIRPRHGDGGHAQWSARDALVLKWVALCIDGVLPVHPRCVHLKGHRGGRTSLELIAAQLATGARFVYRTDIRGYYQHINKAQLYRHVCSHVQDPVLRDLIAQYLYYSVEDGGDIRAPPNGISRGCALSPLMGATLLYHIDSAFTCTSGLFYVRYMDDFLFLSDRRWPIRRARAQLHHYFDLGGFECHPDKTQIGRVEKGFDWLGVWFTEQGAVGIAPAPWKITAFGGCGFWSKPGAVDSVQRPRRNGCSNTNGDGQSGRPQGRRLHLSWRGYAVNHNFGELTLRAVRDQRC